MNDRSLIRRAEIETATKLCADSKVAVLGAYKRTLDAACCGSQRLLQQILRDEWGFEGYVVWDCGTIQDFHKHHKITKTPAESAALAVKNGCDLNCGHGLSPNPSFATWVRRQIMRFGGGLAVNHGYP